MRLMEEILNNADHELKVMINADLDHFIKLVKAMSQIKGCRWDDIVLKFEYEIIELPPLLKRLASAPIPPDMKNQIEKRLKEKHELDMDGLEEIIGFCDTMEKMEFTQAHLDIMKKTGDASRERIKKA